MKWERFNLEHRPLLEQMLKARGESAELAGDVPSLGVISFDDQGPVAIAFIRRCEGALGMIEGLVSNPERSALERHLGIDMAIKQLIEFARGSGITRILSYSVDEGTIKRAAGLGFTVLPHRLFILGLGDVNGFRNEIARDAE
jgi:hypothetical protein